MSDAHRKATIISMAVIASALATLLHEGLGHGVTAQGRLVRQTENHLEPVSEAKNPGEQEK
jgi:hypothetical protein